MLRSLVALGLAAGLAREALAADYVILPGKETGGGSIGGPTYVYTTAQCQAVCSSSSTCTGFTFVVPSGSGDGPCYLKNACDSNAVMNPNLGSGLVSGVMSTSSNDNGQCSFTCGSNADTRVDGACQTTAAKSDYVSVIGDTGAGAILPPTRPGSEAACQANCDANPDCTNYTYNYDGGFCYLKNDCDAVRATIATDSPSGTDHLVSGFPSNAESTSSSCSFTCGGTEVMRDPKQCANTPDTLGSEDGTRNPAPQYSAKVRVKKAIVLAEAAYKKSLLACPAGQTACSLGGFSGGYECVYINEELERCGACDNDCTRIPGVKGVACSEGRCVIDSCKHNYRLVDTEDGNSSCKRVARLGENPARRIARRATSAHM